MLRDHEHAWLGGGFADPGHLGEIKLDPGQSDELVVDQSGVEGADGQAVGARGKDRVGSDQVAGAGKVAHDKRGARQV